MVRLQQSSEPFMENNWTIANTVGRPYAWKRDDVSDALMRSFTVIVLDVFGDGQTAAHDRIESDPAP